MKSGRVCLKCELICRMQEEGAMKQSEKDAVGAKWATLEKVKQDAKRENKAGRGAWGRFLRYHCASGWSCMGVPRFR